MQWAFHLSVHLVGWVFLCDDNLEVPVVPAKSRRSAVLRKEEWVSHVSLSPLLSTLSLGALIPVPPPLSLLPPSLVWAWWVVVVRTSAETAGPCSTPVRSIFSAASGNLH
jgi:hypothetical protein